MSVLMIFWRSDACLVLFFNAEKLLKTEFVKSSVIFPLQIEYVWKSTYGGLDTARGVFRFK